MALWPGSLPFSSASSSLGVPAAGAQESRATIAGTITDVSGGVLPGATVTITNVAMGTSTEVIANSGGLFSCPSCSPVSTR